MELNNSNRKRKGFVKGKLVMLSFYRAASKQPPSSTTHAQFNTSKLKPSPLASSMGYMVNQDHHHRHLMNNTQAKQRAIPASNVSSVEHNTNNNNVNHLDQHAKQRVVPPPSSTAAGSVEFIVNQEKVTPQLNQRVSILLQESSRQSYANVDSRSGTVAADEGVDMDAASYISSVLEKFRLQRMNSEHKKFEDMQHKQMPTA